MTLLNDIHDLQQKVLKATEISSQEERFAAGFALNQELRNLYETNLFSHEERVEFMAAIKILIENVLV
jgi:cell division protein ZapA (FtsZ GTPase activity inhibitor)